MKTHQIIKRVLLTIIFIAGTVSYVNAQGQRGMPQIDFKKIAETQIAWLSENFELTEDQTKKISELHTENAELRQEVFESGLTPRDEKFREQMDALNIAMQASLQEVLTEDQWKSFEEKKEEYDELGRPQRPRRGRN